MRGSFTAFRMTVFHWVMALLLEDYLFARTAFPLDDETKAYADLIRG